jgi:hypothetical protein
VVFRIGMGASVRKSQFLQDGADSSGEVMPGIAAGCS